MTGYCFILCLVSGVYESRCQDSPDQGAVSILVHQRMIGRIVGWWNVNSFKQSKHVDGGAERVSDTRMDILVNRGYSRRNTF